MEPDRDPIVTTMLKARNRRISAANWLESCIIVDRRRWPAAASRFETLLSELDLEIVSVSPDHAVGARLAYQRFGRGNHPARLNYGDCFAYALAKAAGEPLLFKGNDFSQTDIVSALSQPTLGA